MIYNQGIFVLDEIANAQTEVDHIENIVENINNDSGNEFEGEKGFDNLDSLHAVQKIHTAIELA